MAPAKLTPAQARDRKAKRVALVLTLVLVAALAIQGPQLLKMMNGSSAPVSASTVNAAPVSGSSTTSTPTPTGAPAAAPATTTTPGQLNGLGRFAVKDPFYAQNVTTTTTASPVPSAPASAKTPTTSATTTTTTPAATTPAAPSSKPPAATTPVATTPTPPVPFTVPTPATPPNAVVLLTNGKREVIPVGQVFPSEAPLFKLNGVGTNGKSAASIRVSVIGGSFTSGVKTVGIETGKTITFDNESDGTRYVVKVLRLTTVPTTPGGGSATPATTTTPAPSPAASTSSSKG